MTNRVAEFTDFRKRMNERILAEDNQVVRRFFALDWQPNWIALTVLGGFGVLFVLAAGLWATRRITSSPPAQMLRSLQG